jgi:(p)ppGpp synthase/HD superfamily hydrolase
LRRTINTRPSSRPAAEGELPPNKAFRKWDGKTPYAIHPTWCSMTLLAETRLPEHIRHDGARALLMHDLLEDTTQNLPEDTSETVRQLVLDVIFKNSDEEMQQVWSRSDLVLLLKLYDKVSNLLDGSWMSPEKLQVYKSYVSKLCDHVETVYGPLNIVKIANALAIE